MRKTYEVNVLTLRRYLVYIIWDKKNKLVVERSFFMHLMIFQRIRIEISPEQGCMFKQRFSLWGPWSFWGVKGGFHILPPICAPVLWANGRDRLLMARCFVFCKYRTIYPDPPSTQNLHIIHSYPMVLVLLYLFLEIHGTMVLSHYYPVTNYPLLSQYYPIIIP